MFNVIVRNSRGETVSTTFISESTCTLGSQSDNQVVLSGWTVARVHAELSLKEDGVYVANRARLKALRVNDSKVDAFGPLTLGDTIAIGDYHIKVQIKRGGRQQADEDSPQDMEQLHHRVREKVYWAVANALAANTSVLTADETRAAVHQLIGAAFEAFKQVPAGIDRNRVGREVMNEFVGNGALDKLLQMEDVNEIMVNAPDEIFYQTDEGTQRASERFTNDDAVIQVIKRIVRESGRRIDERSPMVDARMRGGSRINAIIPPLAIKGPSLTIRRYKTEKLTGSHLVNYQSLSPNMLKFLELAVKNKRNIVIAGGTGSGKSTLLNILSNFIPEHERVVTIEDAAELELSQPNLVSLETRPADVDGHGAISIRDLVRNSLRMSPDRIVVGECRGGEALDMLQAMNTGHDGSLTTIHANSPRDCINRLEVLVLMSGMELPVAAIRGQIQSGVHLIIQQNRFPCGSRRITSISEVSGVESNTVQLGEIFRFQQDGFDADGKVRGRFMATGYIPVFLEKLQERGTKIDFSLFE
ncbi:MAG TPA: ATPase, T2SS/T4P/T4SS family [Candidatus Kapabacteria bacterium]|nr:ATPase, T2SS/T4P/T4SS family [Candidatus Kapabacteria bacterium]